MVAALYHAEEACQRIASGDCTHLECSPTASARLLAPRSAGSARTLRCATGIFDEDAGLEHLWIITRLPLANPRLRAGSPHSSRALTSMLIPGQIGPVE